METQQHVALISALRAALELAETLSEPPSTYDLRAIVASLRIAECIVAETQRELPTLPPPVAPGSP